jgi:hypothetical protein
VVDANLWNEKSRLSPKFVNYHTEDHTFRIVPKDLDMIACNEKNDQFKYKLRSISLNRRESIDRFHARKLERQLL